ncbi:hypothetical protein P1831_22845 (plasmid) [Salmonella enterica subsp. enterica serovar Paratyphi B]|nr:hypothetical protein P1707_22815 [Salmonella enterica subsp. enterica serovar Paratyphi B]WHW62234.1 hypothetical protein P1831_22845 [Salmonella enterica subsp. enterica serovar Paratyphi B]
MESLPEQLNNKIERAEKRLNAGIAGVAAMSSIPYVAENNFSYGIGLGNYQNGNAIAAGIQYKMSVNTAKWHLNRSQFGIRIDHDLASISDHSLASQSITIWHASDH